jgi:hypothetical protein
LDTPNLPFVTVAKGSTAGIALSDFGLISFHGEAPFKTIFVISNMLLIVGVFLGGGFK